MSIITAYQNLVKNEKIKYSTDQNRVIEKLQQFDNQIGFFSKYQGLYLYGKVGRGKSLILDLYSHNSKIRKRKRVHFHKFIEEIHYQLKLFNNESDTLLLFCKSLAKKVKLLLLDELQIYDTANAMILSQFFKSIFKNKVFMLITSNYHPDELYKNGLQRENFLPTIELIKQKMQVIEIDGEQDYRLINKNDTIKYFINDESGFKNTFSNKTKNLPTKPFRVSVNGRVITIKKTVRNVALCTFEELCTFPLGAGDYRAIAENFDTIFLNGIPKITDRNEIMRFIILIDELYEHKIDLFCLAKYKPEFICNEPSFARTYSRLVEMCGNQFS